MAQQEPPSPPPDVRRPPWWKYPAACAHGHPWGPGLVTVGWMPCDCPAALTEPGRGHLYVRCRAERCPSIWYRPQHLPGEGSFVARRPGR